MTNFLSIDNVMNVLTSHLFQFKFAFIVIFKLLVVANSTTTSFLNKADALPLIHTNFTLPSPIPTWPPGGDFATGEIDLGGGFRVRQITTFQKVWTASGGGPAGLGATFLEPSPIPDGFSMLGSYAQPNNRQLSGWVLIGKTNATDKSGDILKQPADYSLIWVNDDSSDNSPGYFWLPTPPDGYKAVGLIVTTSPEKPSLDRIRCVRSDFTSDAETDSWIWGHNMNVYGLRPRNRGKNAKEVSVGTFTIQNNHNAALPLSCLRNKKSNSTGMLNLNQMEAVFRAYAPYIYFHPDEDYLPSSVDWFFSNGALLYKKGEESNPIRIGEEGANLPQGGANDGSYWLDLPAGGDRDRVKKGNLESAEAYVHFKPIFGGSFTDMQVWLFYPFNGHATAKLGFVQKISLGNMGEHVSDWEHVTLRISNFDGALYKVYFSQHSGGEWVDSCLLEFETGNKFVVYASRNGHATSYKEGLYLQGAGDGDGVGIRNDWEKSERVMDTGARFLMMAAETVAEPPWLNYNSTWGPTEDYGTAAEVRMVKKWLPEKLKKALEGLVKVVDEVFGKDGPTGPKAKNNWNGDER